VPGSTQQVLVWERTDREGCASRRLPGSTGRRVEANDRRSAECCVEGRIRS